ncbi:hypothetical protein [Streptomyces syringium]|uniref:hypothetical protein n=1 Tax=Streptomyces syringium TaxID=76729 RepID=UPI003455E859
MRNFIGRSAFVVAALAATVIVPISGAPQAMAAECGGSLSDWVGPQSIASYTATGGGNVVTLSFVGQRVVATFLPPLGGDNPAHTTGYDFGTRKIQWEFPDPESTLLALMESPACAQGGTRVTSSTFRVLTPGGGPSLLMTANRAL